MSHDLGICASDLDGLTCCECRCTITFFVHYTQLDCDPLPKGVRTIVEMMSEADNVTKQDQEKDLLVRAKAEADDQNTSEAMKETMLNIEDGAMHQGKSDDERSAETGVQGIENEASLRQATLNS